MMDNQLRSITLSNDPYNHSALDFDQLRNEGILLLQRLAGNTWTDHNTHDPGITILDQLCYALSELSYRAGFDITQILAQPGGNTYNSLYSPATILTTNPVTLNDFRKVLLDIEGVKNAWIEKAGNSQPVIYFDAGKNELTLDREKKALPDLKTVPLEPIKIKGLYNVYVFAPEVAEKIIRKRLYACRNLCEDYEQIHLVSGEKITIAGKIEIGNADDINKVAARILSRLANWISPGIRFYTLAEMLAKGKTVDEVMDGPALEHGFIDDGELEQLCQKPKLYASDLIREIMTGPEVRVADNLCMYSNSTQGNWVLALNPESVPVLDVDATLGKLKFEKDGRELNLNNELVKRYFDEYKQVGTNKVLPPAQRDILPPEATHIDLSAYYSIQHHFPDVYGIGEGGLPETAGTLRQAQAKQLKAYLLFFEQILANYFQQVAGVKNLFGFSATEGETDGADIWKTTYFSQSLVDKVPGIGPLLSATYQADINSITESPDAAISRKNRFLNHLLARFAESMDDYALWLQDVRLSQAALADDAGEASVSEALIHDKLDFLAGYPVHSSQRGKGFDYFQPSNPKEEFGYHDNVSGLEKRIAAKLGIKKPGTFYLIEHILLRPFPADEQRLQELRKNRYCSSVSWVSAGCYMCVLPAHDLQNGDQIVVIYKGKEIAASVSDVFADKFNITLSQPDQLPEKIEASEIAWRRADIQATIFAFTENATENKQNDPYSFQLTFVFGTEKDERFVNQNFLEFVKTTVRQETPAHITVYIKWLENETFERFEQAYSSFIQELRKLKNE
ncbi:hypothetical protein SAMN05216490_2542 [Mucilaginibacter mallensis]|uniref:Uncharacterized protein n=1 Tax=Mucilaginibacter mallensis TaxID=652787 RepID=A0A1H1XU08_MUCMA|nr:hypothetical protein [Mucilaginibacter mallensis]SDT12511.1 hypothetical protein SAMN05216490_2542 [Mucilaginibacter mallensis]